LYLLLSGPDDISSNQLADGATMEWYQPVHEPFQLLSYPWDITQLKARYPGLDMQGQSNIFPTNEAATFSFDWMATTEPSVTDGSTQTNSYDYQNTVTGTVGEVTVLNQGVQHSIAYDYGNSVSASTVNTNTIALSASQGITASLPGSYKPPALYQY